MLIKILRIKILVGVIFLCFDNTAYAKDTVATANILKKYKQYLINGTYDGQDWAAFANLPKSRYATFKFAFMNFEQFNGKIIVELGTTRSFVHGALPGCNNDNPIYWTPNKPENWDWGAGSFTRVAIECLARLKPKLYTIDLSANHLQRCKIITQDYKNLIQYVHASSLDFLKKFNKNEKIDLIYIDTGDMTPIEPTALLQLEEAKIIVERNLISDNGIILIDDVRNQTPKKFGEQSDLGKAKYSIPFFLSNGYEIIMDEYQVILKKKKK